MGRLIDADALIENIRKRHYIDKALSEIFETIIDEQPTAYDIEKVVAELERVEEHCLNMCDWQGQSAIADAIEIVKKGGVNG